MNNLFKGAQYLLTGLRLIHQKGIRRFAYLPIVINSVLFSLAIWFGLSQFDQWLDSILPGWLPQWLLSWLIWPLFASLLLIIVFFSFSIVTNLLAAPFNGLLAEAVASQLLGQTIPTLSWQQTLKQAPQMIYNELAKLLYLARWIVPLLILSLIPALNILSPLLWVLFSSWLLAINYHDYPMGNEELSFAQQRVLLKQHPMLALGFGGATLLATLIPFINFLVIPAAVAGATALYIEQLKPYVALTSREQ